MIYNGHDYIPYNSVLSLSGPGDIYFYKYLGDGSTNNWSVNSYSSNVSNVAIDYIDGFWYFFVDATYSANGTYQDEVDIRDTSTTPNILRYYGWTAIIGYITYSGPIWKDYAYQVPLLEDRIQYLLMYNGNSIYKGWTYNLDGTNEIVVNEICRNYLDTNFPTALNTWYQDYAAEKNFELYIGLSEIEEPTTKAAELHFIYDWSYDDAYLSVPSESWLAMEPLQDFYDSRQYQIFSVNEAATLTFGNTTYTNSNNARSLIKTQFSTSGTATLGNGTYSRKFKIQDNCGLRYCLYYVNSRGGWDSVLVDGKTLETDKYKRNTYIRNYRTPSLNRGVVEYRNNITEAWTLNLKNLTDEKNRLFHNLYESTNVFLHDLETGRLLPVIITSTDMQYKTRKNQGKKAYTYQIVVESAQRKIRM